MSLYHTIGRYDNLSYLRFLAASLALHFALFLMLSFADSPRIAHQAMIPVSILEKPETEQRESPEPPKAPLTRNPLNTRAMIAKPDALRAPAKTAPTKDRKQNQNEMSARPKPLPAPPSQPVPVPTPREIIPEQSIVAERALPTIKELLPPANWSSSGRSNTPVSLNTSD
ncbi:MAG TPA: hypothetical protein VJQ55_00640, partial [Candidatus Binatia bacterium]|nr:hypothetical protein [Candidatus Binatia bacterium]